MSNKYLVIKADTNDADYIEEWNKLEGWVLENINVVKKVWNTIKEHGNKFNYNWPDSEYGSGSIYQYVGLNDVTEDDIEVFSELCPYGEFGIHSIKSVKIVEVVEVL